MTRRVLTCLSCLLAGCIAMAQGQPSAVILDLEADFTLSSPRTGTYKVVKEVQVMDKDGEDAALFRVDTDSYTSISSFSGTVSHGGRTVAKLSRKDLMTQSLSSGLAEDEYATYYSPSAPYPYTVRYEYTVSYRKGVAYFSVFMPVDEERLELRKASYSITVPSGVEIAWYSPMVEPSVKKDPKGDVYKWEVPGHPGFTAEHQMPSILEFLPYVCAAPVDFEYGGVPGSQRTWEDVARWNAGLQKDMDDLPGDFREKIRAMVGDCVSDYDKVKVLYRYLRENTRYVSIQYGLGGYVPFPASSVVRSGFGDCKALSFFFKSMLAEAGVASDYVILNTERASFFPNFSSFAQMNHAVVAVPLPEMSDTLWVECTNPKYPLGYRHDGIAGHEVVLVREDGGGMRKASAYPDSLRRTTVHTSVSLSADGSAVLRGRKDLYLSDVEPYIGFGGLKPEDQARALTSAMVFHPDNVRVTGYSDNFEDYPKEGRSYVPHIGIDYSMDTKAYAQVSSGRLFLPFNPVASAMSFQRSERRYDLVIRGGYAREEEVSVEIPEGYSVESLPSPVELEAGWGTFTASASLEDGKIVTHYAYCFRPCRLPGERYPEFRDFARAVTRACDARIVLVKR